MVTCEEKGCVPSPTSDPSRAFHLHDTVRKNAGQRRGHGADEIENGVATGDFIARVPCRQEINTAGEETSFQQTK